MMTFFQFLLICACSRSSLLASHLISCAICCVSGPGLPGGPSRDFDLAPLTSPKGKRGDERAGTIPFMAINLLQGNAGQGSGWNRSSGCWRGSLCQYKRRCFLEGTPHRMGRFKLIPTALKANFLREPQLQDRSHSHLTVHMFSPTVTTQSC